MTERERGGGKSEIRERGGEREKESGQQQHHHILISTRENVI